MEDLKGMFPQLHGPLPFGQFRECEPWRYCRTVARRLLAPGLVCGQENDTAMLPAAALLLATRDIQFAYEILTSPLQNSTG
jgi:hypothetical protein